MADRPLLSRHPTRRLGPPEYLFATAARDRAQHLAHRLLQRGQSQLTSIREHASGRRGAAWKEPPRRIPGVNR
eukprot:scaffold990_cov393-Prasinococcus_capsulatus_cf.AAC.4